MRALLGDGAPSEEEMRGWGWAVDEALTDLYAAHKAWRAWRVARGFS